MTRSIEWETKFKRNFKGSRTMAIVTGTFLISWLPFFVISLSYSVNPNINLKAALAAKWLGYSNAPISPLVYTLLDKRLKREVLRLIRKLKHWFRERPWFTRVLRGRSQMRYMSCYIHSNSLSHKANKAIDPLKIFIIQLNSEDITMKCYLMKNSNSFCALD